MATDSEDQETPEYRAFRFHYHHLAVAIQDPLCLAIQLFSLGVIPSAVRERVKVSAVRLERNEALLSAVEARIQTEPSQFSVFLSALKEDCSVQSLVKRMEGTRKSFAGISANEDATSSLTEEAKQDLEDCLLPFPYLDTSDLTEEAKQDLEDRLQRDTEDIIRKYSFLVTDTNKSLQKQEVNPKDLAICVLSLRLFQAEENQQQVLSDVGKKIQNASSIQEIFLQLVCYWSFFNYELLEHIIKVHGTPEDEAKLQTYLNELKVFCKRRIFEVPPHVYGNENNEQNWAKFTVKLDDEVQTLQDLHLVRRIIAKILDLHLSKLHLCHITKGCVEVVFMIPQLVAQKVFPLTDGQQKSLLSNHVVRNTCNQVYFFGASHSKQEPQLIRQPSKTATKPLSSRESTAPAREVLVQHRRKEEEELKTMENRKEELLKQQQEVVSEVASQARSSQEERSSGEQRKPLPMSTSKRSLSFVCEMCFSNFPERFDLTFKTCLVPKLHIAAGQVSVFWSLQKSRLVHVRPVPKVAIPGYFISCNGRRCRGKHCTYAHNEEEQKYWNSILQEQRVHGTHKSGFTQTRPNKSEHFSDLKQPPMKEAPTFSTLSYKERILRMGTLNRDNYQAKFKLLLSIEEQTHQKILGEKCDGDYTLVLHQDGLKKPPWIKGTYFRRFGYLEGMIGDKIAYATQASEAVILRFTKHNHCTSTVKAKVLLESFHKADNRLYIGFDSYNVIGLQKCLHIPDERKKDHFRENVQVQFEIKHSYFKNLHRAVDKLSSAVIAKLLPEVDDFDDKFQLKRIPFPSYYKYLKLDKHQFKALQAAVFCNANAPTLIAGPFGTGKTRLLAVAAYYFLEESPQMQPVRVLVCAHHQASADTFMDSYFGLMKTDPRHPWKVNLTRLRSESYHHFSREYWRWHKTPEQFEKKCKHHSYNDNRLLIITTFLTSLRLIDKYQSGYFTHILLDEGAQSREPEAIGPLCLANKDTKVVIAGDHYQVGPALLVLGDEAQEGRLGISLLERLHEHYTSKGEVAKYHWATLLTNYRNREEILTLPSFLFYNGTVECRGKRRLHPGTHFPLLFVCSSMDENAQSTENDKYPHEAEVVLQQVMSYTVPWPEREWGPKDVNEICILTPTRNQVNELKRLKSRKYKMLKKVSVLPTYLIQGREFQAVFLSTSEPTLSDLKVSNPTKSISDPYVFNTAITRAQSLVVSVGNPFTLLKIEKNMVERYHDRGRCWTYYLTYCLQNNTIHFPDSFSTFQKLNCLHKLRRYLQPTSHSSPEPNPNSILKAYLENARRLRESGRSQQTFHSDEVTDSPYSFESTVPSSSSQSHSGQENMSRIPKRSPTTQMPITLQAPEQKRREQLYGDTASLSPQHEDWERESTSGISEISLSSFSSKASIASSSRGHSSGDTSGYYSEEFESSQKSDSVTQLYKVQQSAAMTKPQKTGRKKLHSEVFTKVEHSMYYKSECGDEVDLSTIKRPLKRKHYQQKFHHLLFLEEDAHIKSITERCNGTYTLSVFEAGYTPIRLYDDCRGHVRYGNLSGEKLDADTIENIKQSSGGGLVIAEFPGYTEHACADIVQVRGSAKRCVWIAFDRENIEKVTSSFPRPKESFKTEAAIVFTFTPSYFDKLHSALSYLPFEVINRLVPTSEDFVAMSSASCEQSGTIPLDEYQERILQAVSDPHSNAVVTVCGPSGSGISQLLIAATYSILKANGQSRVLVCTRQESSADMFLEHYLEVTKSDDKHAKDVCLTRVIPNSGYKYNKKYKEWYDTYEMMKFYLQSVRLVVTTCLNSLAFVKESVPGIKLGFFTHILMDEGAQMQEPELVAPLCLAISKTKIVIAGNPFEVGPSQVLLSEEAERYGLGKSPLERIRENYEFLGGVTGHHSLTLMKSHRSQCTEILYLPSLFYRAPLQCSVPEAILHPLAKYPLVFVCSGSEDTQHTQEEHVKAVLEEITKYAKKGNWPQEWGKAIEKICVVVSGNEEKLLFRKMTDSKYRSVKRVRVHSGFKFLGKEYRAIFLSMSESALPDGEQNPAITKCLCNPYILNTTFTHAQSLVVSVGNPFKLLKSEEIIMKTYGSRAKCWTEYLRHCLSKDSFHFVTTASLDREKVRAKLQKILETR